MPCSKCRADFNLLTWKIRCIECEMPYCSKCLKKQSGCLFCDTCLILNKRPPDREKLMELRSKDLQQYLNKNKVSTHGLVEKRELVDLVYRNVIPPKNRKYPGKLSTVIEASQNIRSSINDSMPNLASQSQTHINTIRSYYDSAVRNCTRNEATHDRSPIRTEAPQPPVPQTSVQPEVPPESPVARKLPKLSDFKTVEELNELSVKQLKQLLTLNRVDYRGCVEKGELLDRAVRLWNDKKQHETEDFNVMDNVCKICMDAPLDCVILECGHIATCIDCGKQLAECPICRQFVTRVVRTFKA